MKTLPRVPSVMRVWARVTETSQTGRTNNNSHAIRTRIRD